MPLSKQNYGFLTPLIKEYDYMVGLKTTATWKKDYATLEIKLL